MTAFKIYIVVYNKKDLIICEFPQIRFHHIKKLRK